MIGFVGRFALGERVLAAARIVRPAPAAAHAAHVSVALGANGAACVRIIAITSGAGLGRLLVGESAQLIDVAFGTVVTRL